MLVHRPFIEVDTNKLTDPTVRNAKPGMPPRKFADGGGMFLSIQPSGSKWWRLACRFGGKQKLSALGTYADTGLADARLKHHAARNLLANSVDPSAPKSGQARRNGGSGNPAKGHGAGLVFPVRADQL